MKPTHTRFHQLMEQEQHAFMKRIYEIAVQLIKTGIGVDGYGIIDSNNYKKFQLNDDEINNRTLIFFTIRPSLSDPIDTEWLKGILSDIKLDVQNKKMRYFAYKELPQEGYNVLITELVP